MMKVEAVLGCDVHQIKLRCSELNLHRADPLLLPKAKVILKLLFEGGLIWQ
jgi:hypothetical protein